MVILRIIENLYQIRYCTAHLRGIATLAAGNKTIGE